jgi:hypothetical protein
LAGPAGKKGRIKVNHAMLLLIVALLLIVVGNLWQGGAGEMRGNEGGRDREGQDKRKGGTRTGRGPGGKGKRRRGMREGEGKER